jgi:hypothetical protein
LNDLNDGLAYTLEAQDFENFQGMVNKALVLKNRRGVTECKHKLVRQHQSGSSSRPRVAPSSARPIFCPAQPQFQQRPQSVGQRFSTLQHQVIPCPNNFQTPAAINQNDQRTQDAQDPSHAKPKCYAYGEKCHLAN